MNLLCIVAGNLNLLQECPPDSNATHLSEVIGVCLKVWCDPVESVHADLVTHEAAGVGGESSEHDGHATFVHGPDALLLHEVPKNVAHPAVLALGS